MLRLLKYLKGYYPQAVATPLLKFIETITELIIPLIVASIVDNGIANNDSNYIITRTLLMAGLSVSGFFMVMLAHRFAAKAAIGFGTNIRSALFKHINKLSNAEIDKIGPSSLVTRLTGDVVMVQNGLGMFIRLVMRSPFLVFGSLVLAMTIDLKMSLIFLGMTILTITSFSFLMTKTFPKYRVARSKLDSITRITNESLTGARVVRAFCNQDEQSKSLFNACEDAAQTNIKIGRIAALISPVAYLLVNVSIILILYFGGIRVHIGDLTQGQIIALISYMMQLFLALTAFANITTTFTRAVACSGRINEIFDLSPSVIEGTETVSFDTDNVLKFESVCFAYDADGDILSDINFNLKNGQKLGIIGGTGAGKSTLISLILRFYNIKSGEIYYYGKKIEDYTFNSLRDSIGYVPQKAGLLEGSLLNNIRMGDESISEDDAVEALNVAQAHEILEQMGLSGHIIQKGQNLSGGQRQRITIARALAKKPRLLILDDATSALDFKTEKRLFSGLKKLDMTMIIISQRVNTIKNADNILVLEEGKILSYGSHKKLLENCSHYREIYQSQTESARA